MSQMQALMRFAEDVADQIKEYLPEEYQMGQCQSMVKNMNNNLQTVTLNFIMPDMNMGPSVQLEDIFEEVRGGRSIESAAEQIAGMFQDAIQSYPFPENIDISDYHSLQDYLKVSVINTKANRQLLKNVPHYNVEDLSLICKVRISMDNESGFGSLRVTHDMLKYWGISKDELFKKAVENSVENAQPYLIDVESVIVDFEKTPDNLMYSSGELPGDRIYTLTNRIQFDGASVLFYPGVAQQLAKMFPEGYYALPSSLDEFMICPKALGMTPKELGEIVREANGTIISKEEMLSDRVYEYDKKRGIIQQVPESMKLPKRKEMER